MKIFISLALTMIIVIAGVAVLAIQQFKAPGHNAEAVIFEIQKGSGSRQIAADLEQQGVISNKWIFLGSLKLKGPSSTLKAGEYEIAPHASIKDIQEQLISGRVIQRKFTIPEGRTSFEIIQILNATQGMSGEVESIPAEGALLPDTYHFTRDEPRMAKIAQMEQAMDKVHQELWDGRASDLPFSTWQEALTLASIVEKETGKASERKIIAGVFINRLRLGIPLQSDPTVIYALTNGRPKNEGQGPLGRRLLSKDLEIVSPYNTYKNAGLPPTPIANPGREAIEAVLHPENNDFLYFVADGTGGHVFAKTLAEHNKNVAEWRKLRRSKEK